MHLWALRAGRHENGRLQHAWNKYGETAFVFAHSASALKEEWLCGVEQQVLDCAVAEGLELNIGRTAERPRTGLQHTEAVKQLLSAQRKGVPLSAGKLARRRTLMAEKPNPMQGRKHTEETKRLISERLKGTYAAGRKPTIWRGTEETRAASSQRHKNNTHRLNKGKPVRGTKDGEVRIWPTTIACAKDIGCDLSYPSQRVNTGKTVKGWLLQYVEAKQSDS